MKMQQNTGETASHVQLDTRFLEKKAGCKADKTPQKRMTIAHPGIHLFPRNFRKIGKKMSSA
jgi:hypothetical protein